MIVGSEIGALELNYGDNLQTPGPDSFQAHQ